MTPADLARRLFRDQCNIGQNSTLEAYGETAAIAAMVPLIEALQGLADSLDDLIGHSEGVAGLHLNGDLAPWDSLLEGGQFEPWLLALSDARAALTPQPEEVA